MLSFSIYSYTDQTQIHVVNVYQQAYQNLVDDDAEGFIEVRRRLDSWFPKLSHVATSANGAKIGPHLPDFVVTPQVSFKSMFTTTLDTLMLTRKLIRILLPGCLVLTANDSCFPLLERHEKGLAWRSCRRVEAHWSLEVCLLGDAQVLWHGFVSWQVLGSVQDWNGDSALYPLWKLGSQPSRGGDAGDQAIHDWAPARQDHL